MIPDDPRQSDLCLAPPGLFLGGWCQVPGSDDPGKGCVGPSGPMLEACHNEKKREVNSARQGRYSLCRCRKAPVWFKLEVASPGWGDTGIVIGAACIAPSGALVGFELPGSGV